MKKTTFAFLGFAVALASSRAADFGLFEYAFNVDGTISDSVVPDPLPSQVNLGGFNFSTGLGTIQFSINGSGPHYFSTFYDHEIDEADNTFFNELGSNSGVPAAGQSWEIDEP